MWFRPQLPTVFRALLLVAIIVLVSACASAERPVLESLFDLGLSDAPTTFRVPVLFSPGRRGTQVITVDRSVAASLVEAASRASKSVTAE